MGEEGVTYASCSSVKSDRKKWRELTKQNNKIENKK